MDELIKQDQCFLCGSSKNLKQVRRWKPLSRAVKLIIDFICVRCEKEISTKNKFRFKDYEKS